MSPLETPAAPVELSAWMRDRIAKRTRHVRALGFDPDVATPMLVVPLGTGSTPGTRADRSCDRCDQFVPPGEGDLVLVRLQPAPGLQLFGGLCMGCARREGWPL